MGQDVCTLCEAGKFTGDAGNTACSNCTTGYLCLEGSSAPQPCPGGTHADQSVLATIGFLSNQTSDCVICPPGTSCSVGSNLPTECLPGTIAPIAAQEVCDLCPAGQYQSEAGQTVCLQCVPGFFCEAGAATPVPCRGGTSSSASSLTSMDGCTPVLAGFWAPLGSAEPEPCPPSGFYCPGAADDDVNNGAKPIIVPTGGSTTTEKVDVITKAITLDLSINEYNETKVKTALAERYGVHLSQLSIASSAGSLVLSVTIASFATADDGSTVSSPIDGILATVKNVDDASLSSALGAALGTNVTIEASTTPESSQIDRTINFVCPAGKWCTAGLVVNCTENTYNPLEGQDLGTACLRCPKHSLSLPGSTTLDDCVCDVGFVKTLLDDGTAKCECSPGLEITDDGRCEACPAGTYKDSTGNTKCTSCSRSPIPLAALDHTMTARAGAVSASECVCETAYFMVADNEGQHSCVACSTTWFRGLVGTDCSEPGVTIETLPILPGFYRQSLTSQLVRMCLNPAACAGTVGNGNGTKVVQREMTLDVALEQFNATAVKEEIAAVHGIPVDRLLLEVVPGSVQVTVTFLPDEETGLNETVTRVNAVADSQINAALNSALGTTVAVELSPAHSAVSKVALVAVGDGACAEGYSGPFCALCAVSYKQAGAACEPCITEDTMDPTMQIGLQLGGAFAVLLVGTFLAYRFGNRALKTVKGSLEKGGGITSALKAQAKQQSMNAILGEAKEKPTLRQRAVKLVMKVVGFFMRILKAIKGMGVKIKVLVSLYQVLAGLGLGMPGGAVQYPEGVTNLMDTFDVINIDVPGLMPLDCLFGGINYGHTLVVQTAGPLVIIALLASVSKTLRKWDEVSASTKVGAAKQPLTATSPKASPKRRRRRPKAAEEEPEPQSQFIFFAELCIDVAFFIIFLLYPGNSVKTFKALQCTEFDGVGEDRSRFLVVDYSINCRSWFYVGFLRPYALAMVVCYPIGVPVFFALTMYRNKQELKEIQHLEVSISNEDMRAKLGTFLKGKALREYQPEIDEAVERSEALSQEYKRKRDALPGVLKKLTGGYEMRTYWFELFECARKMVLIMVPIFFEKDSPEQLTVTLLLCFTTFGMYMMYSPFIDEGDDLLSQVAQTQIFFSVLSSLILLSNPDSPAMGVILPFLLLVPPLAAVIFQTGLLDKLKQCSKAADNGCPTPCGRMGVGVKGKVARILNKLLGVIEYDDEEEEEEQIVIITEEEAAKVPAQILSVFKMFDVDQNGTFSYSELRKALEFLDHDLSRPEAADMIKNYDDKPDGRMQLLEFAELVSDLENGVVRTKKDEHAAEYAVPAIVDSVFDKFDTNADGTLSYTELRNALVFYGVDVTQPEAAQFIKDYDDEPDGKMSPVEFHALVKNIEKGVVRARGSPIGGGLSLPADAPLPPPARGIGALAPAPARERTPSPGFSPIIEPTPPTMRGPVPTAELDITAKVYARAKVHSQNLRA